MKNAKIITALLAVSLGLAACATAKTWSATGGSRSDGTVRLSYTYGMFEAPTVDEVAGQAVALQRCRVWGYSGAEAFGGVTQTCNQMGSSGCLEFLVTKEYQCLGTGTPGASAHIMMTPVHRGTH